MSDMVIKKVVPAVKRRPRRRLARSVAVRRVLPWLVVIGLFLVWQLCVDGFQIQEFILPGPHAIFVNGWQFRGPLLWSAWQTFVTTAIGFAVAMMVGVGGGIAIGSSPIIYAAFYPALIGFNTIPKVAVVPILIVWFGVGPAPAVITSFMLSFFPILVNVATGIATVEPELRDVLRALGASPWQVIRKVGLPRSMPYFFASLKVAITVAFIGSILAETVGGDEGIGNFILTATARFELPLAFAALLVTSVMGVIMYAVTSMVEQHMTGWATRRPSVGIAAAG